MRFWVVILASLFSCITTAQDTLLTERNTFEPAPGVVIKYRHVKGQPALPHGSWRLYSNNRLLVRGNYDQGVKNGLWERLFPNGAVHIDGHYLNGYKHGRWTMKRKDGNIASHMMFTKGYKTNGWEGFYEDGAIAARLTYAMDTLSGEQILYHPNGNIMRQNKWLNDGKRMERTYYENAMLFEEVYYQGAKRDSIYRRFHENGAPWEELNYNNGRLTDVTLLSSSEGVKLKIGNFRDGTGTIHNYHQNGELHSIISYRGGLKNGKAQYYLDNTLREEGFFKNDIRVGTWKYFSKYNKLRIERNFSDGQGRVFEKHFGASGEEALEGHVKDGLRDGRWTEYNFYGEPVEETEYKFDMKHGASRKFQGNVTREQGGYQYDEKVAHWQYFNSNQVLIYEEDFINNVQLDSTLVEFAEVAPERAQKIDFKFKPYNRKARFEGGRQAEIDFVTNNLKIPEDTKIKGVRGKVIVMFQVDELGEITDIRFLRKIGYGCDEATEQLISSMPWWQPSLQHGIPTPSWVTRVIEFGESAQ